MKRRTIITSILVIILCLGLISGSTFALFTSESKVNIAVTSGKVNVVATLKDLVLYSATADTTGLTDAEKADVAGELTGTFAGKYYYDKLGGTTFTNGGTAKLEGTPANVLTIDKITPGDKVKVNVDVKNNSNVAIQYRVRVNVLEGEDAAASYKLFKGLKVQIGATAADELNSTIRVSEWTSLEAEDEIDDIPVEIYLPLAAGNEYQGLTTKLVLTVEAVQGNANTATLAGINAVLKASAQKNATMYDAIKKLAAVYTYEQLKGYVWSVDNDLFYAESDVESSFEYRFFKVYTEMPTEQTFSIYADPSWDTAEVNNLTVGFDAGEATGITTVTYDRSTATTERNVVIRTNSNATSVTINAPIDTVDHYGTAGSLNIESVAGSSYHENGKVAYVEIAKGRIVLESGSNIEEIHINKKTNSSFDTVIIANNGGTQELPERITRDAVTVTEETLVVKVESNNTSENVYVYADGVTGTKGSTQKITEGDNKQNENVNSALGQLVLDNGSTGDKAQTEEQKAAAKEEIIESAVIDDIENNENYVARIGTVGYETLQAAWNEGKGKTVVLLTDLTQNAFYAYGNYTLDLNGHTLTMRGHSAVSGAFGTDGGGNSVHTDLTIKNGILNLSGANYSNYGIYNYGTLTLKDLTINSACQTVIYSIGQQWGTAGTTTLDNVIINSTHSSGTSIAVYAYKSSFAGEVKPTVVIKDSTISATYNAVMMYGVNTTVENCTISAENNNALWISNSATGSGITGTITVKGNTTITAGSDYKRVNAASGHTITMIEGTYNFDPSNNNSKNYVDTNTYDVTDNGNGTWTVTVK